MLATQSMNTSSEDTTNHQDTQTIESIDIDGLPKHTAKKVKASISSENNTIITKSPLFTQMTLTQKDEMMEPPKNPTIVPSPEKASVSHKQSHGTDLPDMKFLHDNPYIVIAPIADSHADQNITMQQSDQIQNIQKIIEQVKKTTIDKTGTIEEARKAVLDDESIYIEFKLTNAGPQKR
ncbi:12024_t:CDS:1 [Gigaspora margarita]|uniref:12024_t:CDS:1 n=1 Tax=Gigaspora margarita TaxID=4874 RepID=A0ABN7UAW1_GIGMA|nr:12024_t:CDS:1 [Gigaspora margarita]